MKTRLITEEVPSDGDPTTYDVKAGLTCVAGAGSISVPGWHGFLRAGELVP